MSTEFSSNPRSAQNTYFPISKLKFAGNSLKYPEMLSKSLFHRDRGWCLVLIIIPDLPKKNDFLKMVSQRMSEFHCQFGGKIE